MDSFKRNIDADRLYIIQTLLQRKQRIIRIGSAVISGTRNASRSRAGASDDAAASRRHVLPVESQARSRLEMNTLFDAIIDLFGARSDRTDDADIIDNGDPRSSRHIAAQWYRSP